MVGLIMAAGIGSRISSMTNNMPKCFLELGGQKLIDHQINTLKNNGVHDIVIVTGYKSDLIADYYRGENFNIIKNPFYDVTNVLASAWFARDHLYNGFYFMHADTFFEPIIFSDLMDLNADIVLAVAKKNTIVEEMKVVVENKFIKSMFIEIKHAQK